MKRTTEVDYFVHVRVCVCVRPCVRVGTLRRTLSEPEPQVPGRRSESKVEGQTRELVQGRRKNQVKDGGTLPSGRKTQLRNLGCQESRLVDKRRKRNGTPSFKDRHTGRPFSVGTQRPQGHRNPGRCNLTAVPLLTTDPSCTQVWTLVIRFDLD